MQIEYDQELEEFFARKIYDWLEDTTYWENPDGTEKGPNTI